MSVREGIARMRDEPQQREESCGDVAVLTGEDAPLGGSGQSCSTQGLNHAEDAAIGSDKDGARPSLRQRVDLTNQSCSFLVEDRFAFLRGDIKGSPAETTVHRRFAWLVVPPGRAPALENFHRKVKDRRHALELLRREEGIHRRRGFRGRSEMKCRGLRSCRSDRFQKRYKNQRPH